MFMLFLTYHMKKCNINPLHPNITIHILHILPYKFPKVLTRGICCTIKGFFGWWSFPLVLWPYWVIQGNLENKVFVLVYKCTCSLYCNYNCMTPCNLGHCYTRLCVFFDTHLVRLFNCIQIFCDICIVHGYQV